MRIGVAVVVLLLLLALRYSRGDDELRAREADVLAPSLAAAATRQTERVY